MRAGAFVTIAALGSELGVHLGIEGIAAKSGADSAPVSGKLEGFMKLAAVLVALCCAVGSAQAQSLTPRNYTVDVENRYPHVGALLIVVTDPNPFGLPVGIVAFCSGSLIHDRVFLTAGHCVGPSLPALPPFVKAYVSFSPNALDRSSWILAGAQAVHPALPPCPPPVGCDPTTTGAFIAGDPMVVDLGLVFLTKSAGTIKPAKLAAPGQLEQRHADLPMTTVGYGHPAPAPGGGHPSISDWDGLRKYRTSNVSEILNSRWAAWDLPSSVCFGDSGSSTFFDRLPNVMHNRESIVAVASDGGIDCLSKDIRVRTDSLEIRQWINAVIRQHLGEDAELDQ
jgi:hypothetical protein